MSTTSALEEGSPRPLSDLAARSGSAMVAPLVIKQRMAGVGVFAGVVLLLAWRRGEITSPRLKRSIVGFVAGAVVCLGVLS